MAIYRGFLVVNSCHEALERTWAVGVVSVDQDPSGQCMDHSTLVSIHSLNKHSGNTCHVPVGEHHSWSMFTIPGDLLVSRTDFSWAPRWKDVSFRSRVLIGISLGIKGA